MMLILGDIPGKGARIQGQNEAVVFLDKLPLSAVGKVLRKKVKKRING